MDAVKTRLFNGLHARKGWRFSDSLPLVFFEQLTSEQRVVRYSRDQPQARFERIVGRRAEAMDCVVYAMAARTLVGVPVETREPEVASKALAPRPPAVVRSKFLEGA